MALPALTRRRPTIEEYLRRERDSVWKHEYDDGEILAMAGATGDHVTIATNLVIALGNRLRGTSCRPYSNDLRVRLSGRPKFVYPDVTVICGPRVADPDDPAGESFLNPRLIVEILSPSTERYDRGAMFDRYREVESLREYVLIAQDAARVETYFRGVDGTWAFAAAVGIDAVATLRSLKVDLPLAEVYADVALATGVEDPPPEDEEDDSRPAADGAEPS